VHYKTASRSSPAVSAQLTSVIHTRRTDGHSCSNLKLELEAVWLRSISFLVPNLVEFSSRDFKVLIVSVSMTSWAVGSLVLKPRLLIRRTRLRSGLWTRSKIVDNLLVTVVSILNC